VQAAAGSQSPAASSAQAGEEDKEEPSQPSPGRLEPRERSSSVLSANGRRFMLRRSSSEKEPSTSDPRRVDFNKTTGSSHSSRSSWLLLNAGAGAEGDPVEPSTLNSNRLSARGRWLLPRIRGFRDRKPSSSNSLTSGKEDEGGVGAAGSSGSTADPTEPNRPNASPNNNNKKSQSLMQWFRCISLATAEPPVTWPPTPKRSLEEAPVLPSLSEAGSTARRSRSGFEGFRRRRFSQRSSLSSRRLSCSDVAERLASKSFSVRQLIEFYGKYESTGKITPDTKTWKVVRDIVIPETSEQKCCYMDVMPGGTRPPGKLVSHWWGANFRDTVFCVLEDATGLSGIELEATFAERSFDSDALDANYWLCIFAVNQHVSICGACDCGSTDYAKNPCSCGLEKLNPCGCGSQKRQSGDPLCELDKFDDVMGRMQSIVVALDPDLATVSRVWCVAEIGEAVHRQKPINFVGRLSEKYMDGLKEIKSVVDCDSTVASDKDRILRKIKDSVGFQRFDQTVSRLVLGGVQELALRQAAWDGMVGHVDLLLKMGVRVDAADSFGRTPLMFAAEQGHLFLVKDIIRWGADVNAATAKGETVIMLAAEGGKPDTVRQLLDSKANPHAVDAAGYTAVMMAAKSGSLEVLSALVRTGADVNVAAPDGETALVLAEENGNQELINALLQANANPNTIYAGMTPLMRAAAVGNLKAVRILLEAKADPRIVNEQNETPLMLAAGGSDPEMIRVILNAKANPNVSSFGRTALTVAEEVGNREIIDLLTAAEVSTWSRIERRFYIVSQLSGHESSRSTGALRLLTAESAGTASTGF